MRRALLVTLVVIAGAVGVAIRKGFISFGPYAAACRDNTEVDVVTRDGAAKAARDFYDALLKSDTQSAYAMLSTRTREAMPRLQFEDVVRHIQAWGPKDLEFERSYHPSLVGTNPARVVCGKLSGSNWVSVSAIPGATQAHVVTSARTKNNRVALLAWVVQTGATWEVMAFHTVISDIAGHDAAALLAMAREQDKRGHAINAHLLYVGANQVTMRGPDFQLGIQNETAKALADHTPPAELADKPPWHLVLGNETVTLKQLEISGLDNALVLVMQLSDPAWTGDRGDAEARNRRSIDALIKAHPELEETFGALVARLSAPDQPWGWGTVYLVTKGYLADEAINAKAP